MENEVIKNIKSRRSIRKYKQEQISDEELSQIIEAGQYAPSGGNNQTSHFVVVQNEVILDEIKKLVLEEFSKMEVTENTYKSLKGAILQSQKGTYDFMYNAPTLVIVSNLREYGNAMADSSTTLENMMLAGNSINVGSCWVNQLRWLADNDSIKEYIKKLGIPKNEIICGGVVLGYAEQSDLVQIPRKGNIVTYMK